ncbi:hypothetical protein PENTCL1PPCAC_4110, partial [Pristionchus entomophagus]
LSQLLRSFNVLISSVARSIVRRRTTVIRTGRRELAIKATMKISSPDFDSIFTPDLKQLRGIFEKEGFELRIAGGAVRDLLMGKAPADIDFATSATPTMMVELFNRESVRMLNTNGEAHGTVTCRIGESNFEVTTLRIDEVCDGRRAKVSFTKDWELDANRRDLTINALFLDLNGTVVDYVGGVEDCENRRVRFVGKASQRIQEDFLRILRYFRFFGRISIEGASHDDETIRAIVKNKQGLEQVSPERIWTEMKRIVIGRQAPTVVKTMIDECGMTSLLGLPSASLSHMGRFSKVFDRGMETEKKHPGAKLESMTLVAALCSEKHDIEEFHSKTKLSNAERFLGEFVVERREEAKAALNEGASSPLTYWRRLLAREFGATSAANLRGNSDRILSKIVQLAITVDAPDEVIADLLTSSYPPSFPVDGVALKDAHVPPGPRMHCVKEYLFDLWIKSDFTLTKEELLTHKDDSAIPSPPPKTEKGGKRKRQKTVGDSQ